MGLDILEFNSRYKTPVFQTEKNSSSYARRMEWNDRLVDLMKERGIIYFTPLTRARE